MQPARHGTSLGLVQHVSAGYSSGQGCLQPDKYQGCTKLLPLGPAAGPIHGASVCLNGWLLHSWLRPPVGLLTVCNVAAGGSPDWLTASVQGVRPSGLERVPDRDLAEFINVCISPRNERPRSRQLLKHPYFETIRREKGVCRLREEALAGTPHWLLLLNSAKLHRVVHLELLLRAAPGCTQ